MDGRGYKVSLHTSCQAQVHVFTIDAAGSRGPSLTRKGREKPTVDASDNKKPLFTNHTTSPDRCHQRQNDRIIELHDLSGRKEGEKSAEREWKNMSRLRCGLKIHRKDQDSSPKRRRQINKTKAPSRGNRPCKDLD